MGKCTACGKSGLFLKLNSFGRCNACQESFEANKAKPKEQPIKQEPTPTPTIIEEKNTALSSIDIPKDVLLSEDDFNKKIKDIDLKIDHNNALVEAYKKSLEKDWNDEVYNKAKKIAQEVVDLVDIEKTLLVNRMEQLKKAEQEQPAQLETKIDTTSTNQIEFDDTMDDLKLAYKYGIQNVAGTKFNDINYESLNIGDKLDFVLEPENEYDPKAIKIMHNNNSLGHVYKGQLQDMISDWLAKEALIIAKISAVDTENKSIKYGIAFYKKA